MARSIEHAEGAQTSDRPRNLRRLYRDAVDTDRVLLNVSRASVSEVSGVTAISSFHSWENIAQLGTLLPIVAYVGLTLGEPVISYKWKKKDLIKDPELEYQVGQFVYRGKEPLVLGDTVINKRDNFLDITMPRLECEKGTEPSLREARLQTLSDVVLHDIREKVQDRDYKMVIVRFPAIDPVANAGVLKDQRTIASEQVAQGKDIKVESPDRQVVALTRDEFEDLTASPAEIFDEAVSHLAFDETNNALKDQQVQTLMTRLKSAETEKDRIHWHRLLRQAAQRIIREDIVAYLAPTEISWQADATGQVLTRVETNPRVVVSPNGGGRLEVKFYSGNGDITTESAEKLLEMRKKTLKDIKRGKKPFMRGQMAYILDELLQELSLEELADRQTITKEEFIERLHKEGLFTVRQNLHHLDQRDRDENKLRARKFILPVVAPFIIAAATNPLTQVVKDPERAWETFAGDSPSITQNDDYHTTSFPDELPPHKPVWKVSGTVPTAGYYAESTSHHMNDQEQWEINKEIERAVTYPRTVDAQDVVNLERVVKINPFGETYIKVPIRTDSRLGALDIVNEGGKPIEFRAFELTDGTVEVVIDSALINGDAFASVSAQLIAETDPKFTSTQVHAAEEMTPVLDASKLSPEVNDLLDWVRSTSSSGYGFNNALAWGIQDRHGYSLNPPGKERLAAAQDPESIVNAIESLPDIHCDAATAENVLLSTLDGDPEYDLNLATGFISGVSDNPSSGSDQGFLMEDSRHAFGIDSDEEKIDGTPTQIAADDLTEQYANQLGQPVDSLSSEWDQMVGEITAAALEDAEYANNMKILGAIMLGGLSLGGFFAARQTGRYLRRVSKGIDFKAVADDMVLKVYKSEEIIRAETFLSWLNWSEYETEPTHEAPAIEDKHELLKNLRKQHEADPEMVARYIASPKDYEKAAGLSLSARESMKLRFLARYVMQQDS